MKLLLKREQTTQNVRRVNFKLWAKLELDEDENALLKRYRFQDSLLMGKNAEDLVRRSVTYGLILFVIIGGIIASFEEVSFAALAGLLIGGGFGFWYFNEKRDEVFVRDLLHGCHFTCPSIVDLTKKEAEVSDAAAVFRQVMESAKHWGGQETEDIPVLSREEARDLILKLF